MSAGEKGREMWLSGLAGVLTACFVLAICSSAQAFPPGVAAGAYQTIGLKSDGTVAWDYSSWGWDVKGSVRNGPVVSACFFLNSSGDIF